MASPNYALFEVFVEGTGYGDEFDTTDTFRHFDNEDDYIDEMNKAVLIIKMYGHDVIIDDIPLLSSSLDSDLNITTELLNLKEAIIHKGNDYELTLYQERNFKYIRYQERKELVIICENDASDNLCTTTNRFTIPERMIMIVDALLAYIERAENALVLYKNYSALRKKEKFKVHQVRSLPGL